MQLAWSFCKQRHWDVSDKKIQISNAVSGSISEFAFVEHGDNPTYWQVWHVVGVDRVAFITYTCDLADSELERVERQSIVKSLRWL
jgi:hypothetical protein